MLKNKNVFIDKMNIGIIASECYIPRHYVRQSALESFDSVVKGKYENGLGQTKMSFVDHQRRIQNRLI